MFSLWDSLTLSFLLLFSSHVALKTSKSEKVFVVRVDQSVKAEDLQVQYFLTGDFGGFGGFQIDREGEHAVLIHTEVEGNRPRVLKPRFTPQDAKSKRSVSSISQ
jgi:hypothetical protein